MATADPNNPGYDVDGNPLVQGEVASVASAVSTRLGVPGRDRVKLIERAMQEAVLACLAAGVPISDSDTIRAAQLEARHKAIDAMNTLS